MGPEQQLDAESQARDNGNPDSTSSNPSSIRRIAASTPFQLSCCFAIALLLMIWIEFSGPAILDNDGYYHIKLSKLLRESAPRPPEFKWLPLTTLSEERYVDHHYLFHVLLIPFTYGDLRGGAKMAAAVFSSMGITALFGLLLVFRVRHPWLWLAPIFASSEPFLYRMAMTRAPGLSILLLSLLTYLLFKRRIFWLFMLSFFFVWYYSLFPLVLFFAGTYTVAVYISSRRMDLLPLLASITGVMAGLIVNPWFPKNIWLLREHLAMKFVSTYPVDVGVEWYPYETWSILQGSLVAFALFFAGLVILDFRRRRVQPIFFLIISTGFLLMAFKSRRFIEYWPPFSAVFAAFSIGSRMNIFDRLWFVRFRDRVVAACTATTISIMLVLFMCSNVMIVREDVKSEQDPEAYRGCSEWLNQNTDNNSIVFNADWDDFPMLFYYNTHNRYVAGLDPTYLYDRDHELWKLYAAITLGENYNPGPAIRDRFGADYVFVDNEHSGFVNIMTASEDFELAFTDPRNNFKVFRVLHKSDSG